MRDSTNPLNKEVAIPSQTCLYNTKGNMHKRVRYLSGMDSCSFFLPEVASQFEMSIFFFVHRDDRV